MNSALCTRHHLKLDDLTFEYANRRHRRHAHYGELRTLVDLTLEDAQDHLDDDLQVVNTTFAGLPRAR